MAKIRTLRQVAGARRSLRQLTPGMASAARTLRGAAALSPGLARPARVLDLLANLASPQRAAKQEGRHLATKRRPRRGGSVPGAGAGSGGGGSPVLSDAERESLEKQFGKQGAADIERRLEEQGAPASRPGRTVPTAPARPPRQMPDMPPAASRTPVLSDAERKQLQKQFGKEQAADIERRLEEQEGRPVRREVPTSAPTPRGEAAADEHAGRARGVHGESDRLPDVLERLGEATEKLAEAAEKLSQSGRGGQGSGSPRGQSDKRGKDAEVLESAKGLGGQLGEVAQIAELIGSLL